MKAKITKKELKYKDYFKVEKYLIEYSKQLNPDQTIKTSREVFERGFGVACLPIDVENKEVILIKQFRIGPFISLKHKENTVINNVEDTWIYEIPAGLIEENEDKINTITREMKEETGLDVKIKNKICEYYPSPGGCSETITIYLGFVKNPNFMPSYGVKEEDEDITIHKIKFDEIENFLNSKKANNSMLIISLQWLLLNLNKINDFQP